MFKSFTMPKIGLALFCLLFTLSSCVKNPLPTSDDVRNFDNKVALQWNSLYLDVEKNAGGKVRPPQSARVLAYIGIGTYEALVSGMPGYNSMAHKFSGLILPKVETGVVYHWPLVYNFVYSTLLKKFYPSDPIQVADANMMFKIFSLEQEILKRYEREIPADVVRNSEDYAKKVAEAIYNWSSTDPNGHESYKKVTDPSYAAPVGPGLWKPTSSGAAMGPYWGKVRLFAAQENDRQNGVAPIPFSEATNSKFYQQAMEVKTVVDDIKANKDYEGRWIAEFWSDDMAGFTFTPAGRLVAILNQVVEKDNSNLEKSVFAYAKMGLALNDAAVCCWALKYKWNIERPESYITRVIDSKWKPIMGEPTAGAGNGFTPPFPAYPSGHSTFGAVGSEVMASIFGYNFEIIDRCHENRKDFLGIPRSYSNFFTMANENAYSRIPIGVHFRMDCEEGLRVGYLVGQRVNALPWHK